jgi:hypothetical protein
MAIGRTLTYISYLDDEITKSMTTKEEVLVCVCVCVYMCVCVCACMRAGKRDNVEKWTQIMHIMGTETVVIVLNNLT